MKINEKEAGIGPFFIQYLGRVHGLGRGGRAQDKMAPNLMIGHCFRLSPSAVGSVWPDWAIFKYLDDKCFLQK